jgi:hypothetical protein
MSTLHLRERLVEIATKDVGIYETSRNHGLGIEKFWGATNYDKGYQDRQPYCAAAMCYWVREWLKETQVLRALNFTRIDAIKWRCKSPAAFGWQEWAEKKGLLVMNNSKSNILHTGDIMVLKISHIALVVTDKNDLVTTIEANTNSTGSREGQGVMRKTRKRSEAQCFIRMLA